MKPLTAIIQANQLTRRAFICLAVDSPPPGSRVFALGQLMREEVSVPQGQLVSKELGTLWI